MTTEAQSTNDQPQPYTPKDRHKQALEFAKLAHETMHHVASGVLSLETGTLVLFDNEPRIATDGGLVHALDGFVAEYGHKVYSVATYPTAGPNAGHTKVVIVNGSPTTITRELQPFVNDIWTMGLARIPKQGS